ncbi:MAG TPA: response regulator [Kofleriaceae bacterium]|nr:response regulator [Kofleriaceae bacterium]
MSGQRSIVLVQQDRKLLRALTTVLERAGFAVKSTERGDLATDYLRTGPDLLISDYHARAEDGRGLFKWARDNASGCLRMLLTAESEVHIAVDALESGAVSRFAFHSWTPEAICQVASLLLDGGQAADPDGERATVGRVLLVEDHPQVRVGIARTLERYGFEVIAVEDGAEGMRAAPVSDAQVALVDLVLPKVSGIELARFLKASNPSMVVVAMSGLAVAEARDEAFEAGVDDFIDKPIDMGLLARRVAGYVHMGRVREMARAASARADRVELYAREMTSLLAHDLRNGFAIAEANLYFLRQANLDADALEAVDALDRALKRMAMLAGNLTEVELLETGELVARQRMCDIYEILSTSLEVHGSAVRAQRIELDIAAEPGLSATVDPALFERVIHNLLNNAARYVTENGRIRLAARVEGGASPTLLVEVANTGPALPDGIARAVFGRGGSAADRRSRTGLGLYFCRLACQAHGGSIEVAPREDMQASFLLRFPQPTT